MWTGTFTKNWTTNLTKMGINEATALKLARKIRKQIMHNTAAIWRTRCDVTHDNKERDKTLQKMRETASDAQKAGVFTNANESVQRACEIHKKLADRKKWIATTEKRTADATRAKINRQKHKFMKHFAKKENNKNTTTLVPHITAEENKTDSDSEREREEEDEKMRTTKRLKQTRIARTARELDSSDSEEEPTSSYGNPDRTQQDTPKTTNTRTESSKKAKQPRHPQTHIPRKRQKTTNAPEPQTQRETQLTLPPAGGAAAAATAVAVGRAACTKTSTTKRKRAKDATNRGKNAKPKRDNGSSKKRARNTNQRSIQEYTTEPKKRQHHNHTTQAQEDSPEQQNRSQSSYDTG